MFSAGYFTASEATEDYGYPVPGTPTGQDAFARSFAHRIHLSRRFTSVTGGTGASKSTLPRFVGCWVKAPVLDGITNWENAKQYRISCALNLNNVSQATFTAETTDGSDSLSGFGTYNDETSVLFWQYTGVNPLRSGTVELSLWGNDALIAIQGSTQSTKTVVTDSVASFWNCAALVNDLLSGERSVTTTVDVYGTANEGTYTSDVTSKGFSLTLQLVSLYKGDKLPENYVYLRAIQCGSSAAPGCGLNVATNDNTAGLTDSERVVRLADGSTATVDRDAILIAPTTRLDGGFEVNLAAVGKTAMIAVVKPLPLLIAPQVDCFCVMKVTAKNVSDVLCVELRRSDSDPDNEASLRCLYGPDTEQSLVILPTVALGPIRNNYHFTLYFVYDAEEHNNVVSLEVINVDTQTSQSYTMLVDIPFGILTSYTIAQSVLKSAIPPDQLINTAYLARFQTIRVTGSYYGRVTNFQAPPTYSTRNSILYPLFNDGTGTFTLVIQNKQFTRFSLPVFVEFYATRVPSNGTNSLYTYSTLLSRVQATLIRIVSASKRDGTVLQFQFNPPVLTATLGVANTLYPQIVLQDPASSTASNLFMNAVYASPVTLTRLAAFAVPDLNALSLLVAPSTEQIQTNWSDASTRSVTFSTAVAPTSVSYAVRTQSGVEVARRSDNVTTPFLGSSIPNLYTAFLGPPDYIADDSLALYDAGAKTFNLIVTVHLPNDANFQLNSEMAALTIPRWNFEPVSFLVASSEAGEPAFWQNADAVAHNYLYVTDAQSQTYIAGAFAIAGVAQDLEPDRLVATTPYTRMALDVSFADTQLPLSNVNNAIPSVSTGAILQYQLPDYYTSTYEWVSQLAFLKYSRAQFDAGVRYRFANGKISSYNIFNLETPTLVLQNTNNNTSAYVARDSVHTLTLDFLGLESTLTNASYTVYKNAVTADAVAHGTCAVLNTYGNVTITLNAPLFLPPYTPLVNTVFYTVVSYTLNDTPTTIATNQAFTVAFAS